MFIFLWFICWTRLLSAFSPREWRCYQGWTFLCGFLLNTQWVTQCLTHGRYQAILAEWMTPRRKLRYHLQRLKQLISELTQNFLHLTPCVPLNYAGSLTGAGVQRRTEPRSCPHITLGTLFYTCLSLIPFRTQGMCSSRGEGSLTPLCISAAMTCWLPS